MTKINKGKPGYLNNKRNDTIIITVIMYVIALTIFFISLSITKTKANIGSVLAVLALLPASKSTVSMIMYLKTPKYDRKIQEEIKEHAGGLPVLYELYLTSYQKNYPISSFIYRNQSLIGFSEFENLDDNACEKHISDILKQNGHKNITVKIFKEKNKYLERLDQWRSQDDKDQTEEIFTLLKDISL